MADGVFNIAKGAARKYASDNPNSLVFLLLQAAEADSTLVNYTNVGALLTEAGNTEATFTNYARKTGVVETITIDNTNNRADLDAPDQTWTSAGNGTNETLAKLIIAVSTGAGDANLIPLTHHDFAVTTDGTDLTAQIHADGFYRAS